MAVPGMAAGPNGGEHTPAKGAASAVEGIEPACSLAARGHAEEGACSPSAHGHTGDLHSSWYRACLRCRAPQVTSQLLARNRLNQRCSRERTKALEEMADGWCFRRRSYPREEQRQGG
jgi:hypothetical protein